MLLTGPPAYPVDLLSRRVRGRECYKLGKLVVNLLQVVKRTNDVVRACFV